MLNCPSIIRPDLPLCREALNCSSLHPSRHFSNTSGCHLVFGQLWDFFRKHRYGQTVATVRTLWIPFWALSSIRQVVHSKSRRPDTRATHMEIACIRSTVRITCSMVQMSESLIWKLRATNVRTSGQQGNTVQTRLKSGKNFSEILESRSHNYSSECLMSIVQTAPRLFKVDAHLNL
jgi:hypothetical protein